MTDLLLGVHVVVKTINLEILRCRLADSSSNATRVRATGAARLFFLIQPIRSSFQALSLPLPSSLLKVTVDLQRCLPKNYSHEGRLCYNHGKVYTIVKLIKFGIKRNNLF